MRIVFVAIVAVLAVSAQPKKHRASAAATSYHYRLQPKVGELYRYDNAVELTQTIHVMGYEQAITSNVTLEQDVRTNRRDSLIDVGIRQRNVRVKITGLEQFERPDTVMTMSELEKYQLRMYCTRTGKTVGQEVIADDSTDATAGTMRRQALEQFTGGGVRTRFILEFPDRPLEPGAQWTQTVSDTIDLPLGSQRVVATMDLRHTFEGMLDTLGRRCAVVRVESTRYLISGTAEQMGVSVRISGDGALAVRYLFEVETGLPLLIETSAQLDQRMTLFDQDSGNNVIPMSIDVRGRMVRRL